MGYANTKRLCDKCKKTMRRPYSTPRAKGYFCFDCYTDFAHTFDRSRKSLPEDKGVNKLLDMVLPGFRKEASIYRQMANECSRYLKMENFIHKNERVIKPSIYVACVCPRCGRVQGMYSKDVSKAKLRCKFCTKPTKFYNKKGVNLVKILKVSYDANEIRAVISDYMIRGK